MPRESAARLSASAIRWRWLLRDLDDAEVVSFGRGLESGQYGTVVLAATQTLKSVDEAQRDMDWMVRRQGWPSQMRNGRGSVARPACSFARTAAPLVTKIERKLCASPH